jgi:acyl-CoA thioesterase-1
MQPDGIHPNATAQPLIRDRVWEELLPLLEQDVTKKGSEPIY